MSNKFGMTNWDDVDLKQANTSKRNKDLYMKLQPGDNLIRILTKPFEYWVHRYKADEKDPGFGERVLSSFPLYGTDPIMEKNKDQKPKRRWLVGVIDRKTQSYKILDISSSVFKSIQDLSRDEDWGDPSQYNINIKVDPNGGATGYYNVLAKPKTPLSASDLELKTEIDIEDLKRRTTPPSPEEMLKRIQAIHDKRAANVQNPVAKSKSQDVEVAQDTTEDSDDFQFPTA